MTMLRELLAEITGMFVADARLTVAILGVVALSAVLVDVAGNNPLVGGGVLLLGCLLLLIESVRRTSRGADAAEKSSSSAQIAAEAEEPIGGPRSR